ncbi:MAG: hypothetical protein NVS1B2_04370 [Vulcanimicrobiaceae bacterium]
MRRPGTVARTLVVVAAGAVACALAAIQGVASVAVRDRAIAPAWMRVVPTAVAARFERLSPEVPVPATVRLVLARHALARGDLAYAEIALRKLAPSHDRLALEAALAQRRGDRDGAIRAYLAAGDLSGVEAAVADAQAAGRHAEALALAQAVVARLQADRTQADALAQAYYDLGGARQTAAYALAPGTPAQRTAELNALDAYERASRLAPLSVRYLIALGNQRINVGKFGDARRAFERARDVDPLSAEPWTGLGDIALRRGDRVLAAAMLARARELAPQSDAVRRLAVELDR